jgi:hypothetical protein
VAGPSRRGEIHQDVISAFGRGLTSAFYGRASPKLRRQSYFYVNAIMRKPDLMLRLVGQPELKSQKAPALQLGLAGHVFLAS